MENLAIKGDFQVLERRKRTSKGKMERSPNLLKKECPNYLRMKGKVYATTLSDSDSSNSDSEESCDGEGNYSAFMTIAHVESSEDLSLLVEEFGEHSDEESMGVVEESDVEEDESTTGL